MRGAPPRGLGIQKGQKNPARRATRCGGSTRRHQGRGSVKSSAVVDHYGHDRAVVSVGFPTEDNRISLKSHDQSRERGSRAAGPGGRASATGQCAFEALSHSTSTAGPRRFHQHTWSTSDITIGSSSSKRISILAVLGSKLASLTARIDRAQHASGNRTFSFGIILVQRGLRCLHGHSLQPHLGGLLFARAPFLVGTSGCADRL